MNHKPSFTPYELTVEIKMLRAAIPRDAIVIVEGPTDKALLSEFVVQECILISTNSKQKALNTINLITKKDIKGVLGIVDWDFEIFEENPPDYNANLVYTDFSDMEIMLLSSPAFDKVLRHTIGDFIKLTQQDAKKIAMELRNVTIQIGLVVGYLRWLDNLHREYTISFNKIKYSDVINFKSYSLTVDVLIDVTCDFAAKGIPSRSQILLQIDELRKISQDWTKICRGHDLLAILATILPEYLSKRRNIILSKKQKVQMLSGELSRVLRMSYETVYFQQTDMYLQIKNWEERNPPYLILAV